MKPVFLLFFIFFNQAGLVLPVGHGQLCIEAEEIIYEEKVGLYTAKGNVKAVWGKMTLTADELRFDSKKRDIVAVGNVEINDGEDSLKADRVAMNMDTQTGAVLDGEIHVSKDNTYLRSEKIEKTGENKYRLKEGTMTTCKCPSGKPSWELGSKYVKATIGEYAVARDFVFYVKGVPVFYLPYMVFPVKTEQESGLLRPRYIYSTRDGSEFFLPYYQAFAPWMDATITPEYFTRRGVGGSVEYRYRLTPEREGKAYFRYFNDFISGTAKDRYEGSLHHEDRWGKNSWGKIDIRLLSDPKYPSDFGEAIEISSQQHTESRASIGTYRWPVNTIAEALYYQDISSSLGMTTFTETTYQRLPRISLTSLQWKIPFTPLYFNADGTFDNFTSVQERSVQRIYLAPTLSMPKNLGDVVQVVPRAGMIVRGYVTDTTIWPRAIPRASILVSSKLFRSFDSLTHLIEPELGYLFIDATPDDSIPLIDKKDMIIKTREASASLNNFFVHRFTDGTIREVAELRLTGIHDDVPGTSNEWRGIGEIKIKPIPNFYWKIIGEIGSEGETLTRVTNIFDIHDHRGNRAFVSYSYLSGLMPINEINGGVSLNFFDRIKASYSAQYSFDEHYFLQMITGLDYISGCKCWDLAITWWHRPLTWHEDDRVMVLLTLTGLGTIGH